MGGAANTMATVQVFTALTAAEMQQSGKGSFYLFHGASPRWQRQTVTAQPVQTQTSQTGTPASRSTATTATVTGGTQTPGSAQQPVITGGTGSSSSGSGTDTQPLTGGTEDTTAFGTSSAAGSITQETETTAESAAGTSGTARTTAPAQPIRTEREKYPYRIPLTAAAGAVCGGAVLFFILRKQKSPKTYLTIAGVFCAATALIWFIKIESPEQFYTPEAHTGGGNVTMEIRCDVIRGLPGSEAYPADGIIMPLTEFSIEPDENALTLLYDAVKAYQLQIEVDGVSGDVVETAYVRGIASLYEFDFGDLSGWTYTVNGERPSVGCGSFTLHDGDVIAWIYTIDL
ncbi:MAG: DUF4430 domain-containing protein [Oscillospiraceae bacterium]|nr:DUF4430 domain-containing protein [Oscillospiraceae bacterium]